MSDSLFKTSPPPGITKDGDIVKNKSTSERLAELKAERDKLKNETQLPFLYGWKWYPWARAFFESTNKINLLCAANQISKSSTQIRKCIDWATNQNKWPSLWVNRPVQFWYLYPTKDQATAEFETKWSQFLPRGEMKDDPYYGWKAKWKSGHIVAIIFNSGVYVYFKTYAQDASALQTGTCDAIFCDEELPLDLYEELMFRVSASSGYFHMVFTATLGQEFWRKALEPEEGEEENLPQAFKQVISLYDAQVYEDGTPSHWTREKIKEVEARCSSHSEVLKRVLGKFILLGGRKYEEFDIKRHIKPKHKIPSSWLVYAGVDIGGGGEDTDDKSSRAHKSAICFVAVRPDFRAGRVFLGWRGDNQRTTAGDVAEKYIDMKKENNIAATQQFYDWGARDFEAIAKRMGETFEKAEKSHEIGEQVVNTLFKNDMMFIYDDPELMKLAGELATLKKKENKKNAKDDLADAFRYAVTKIPWDWSLLTGASSPLDEVPEMPMNDTERQIAERRKAFEDADREEMQRVQDEFDEWNQAYDGY